MVIRKAAFADIDTLIRLESATLPRISNFHAKKRPQLNQLVTSQTHRRRFHRGACRDGRQGGLHRVLVINKLPANPHFLSGKTATILNVYTVPEYRRLGIATRVLRHIIDIARQQMCL